MFPKFLFCSRIRIEVNALKTIHQLEVERPVLNFFERGYKILGYLTKNFTLLSVPQYVAIVCGSMQVSLHILQVTAQLYSSWLQPNSGKVEGDMNPQGTAGSLCLSFDGQRVKMPKENKHFPSPSCS